MESDNICYTVQPKKTAVKISSSEGILNRAVKKKKVYEDWINKLLLLSRAGISVVRQEDLCCMFATVLCLLWINKQLELLRVHLF